MTWLLPGVLFVVWLGLIAGRGGFWRAGIRESDLASAGAPPVWPSVTAVVPARNEADMLGTTIPALLAQDYPGRLQVIVVDDQSTDGTAVVARAAADALGAGDRLTVLPGRPLPSGWTGKVWAMAQGASAVEAEAKPDYLLFVDADIGLGDDVLVRLAAFAERRNTVLTSLMARLRADNSAEKLLAPAFVFFFQKLYPFAWVNDPKRATAAAAGGCMLVRREALQRAGGLAAIRDAIIDDCALGALMKRQGPVWLGLAETVESRRGYPTLGEFGRMVSRSAYAELDYSPLKLAGTVAGMVALYLAPPLFALFGPGWPARLLGAATWAVMAAAYWPMLRFYRLSPLYAPALPAIAALYTGFTFISALRHWRGRGGEWKGRYQAAVGDRAVGP
jgi:hopene-associated glycosyltransferase HpnB